SVTRRGPSYARGNQTGGSTGRMVAGRPPRTLLSARFRRGGGGGPTTRNDRVSAATGEMVHSDWTWPSQRRPVCFVRVEARNRSDGSSCHEQRPTPGPSGA